MTRKSAITSTRRALELARESCPHWDYESDAGELDCCRAVTEAKEAYREAIRRARRQDPNSW